MQLSHTRPVASAIFDDPNLVSCAGLVPIVALAQQCGLAALADEHLSVPTDKGANAGAKVTSLVAGMVAGADSIDDMALLRHGAMGTLFDRPVRAVDVGVVPAGIHLRSRPPTRRRRVPAADADCTIGPRCWPGSTAPYWSTSTTPSSKCTATPNRDRVTATPGSAD